MLRQAEIIKWEDQKCPFGLPLPKACFYVGDAAQLMNPGQTRTNRIIYNKKRTHEKCPYAEQIFTKQKAINCNAMDSARGSVVPKMYSGTVYYPRLWEGFGTINLDRTYHQYADFNYMSLNY